MAFGDPDIDPALAAELYGMQPEVPVLPEQEDPWAWAPPDWRGQPEIPAQMIGPDPFIDPSTGTPATAPMDTPPPIEVSYPAELPPLQSVGPADSVAPGFVAPDSIDQLTAPPDAVSAAGGMPAAGEIADEAYSPTLTPRQDYANQVAALQGGSPFDDQGNLRFENKEYGQRYLDELRVRDPARFSGYKAQLDDIAASKQAAERQKIVNADWERAQQIERDRKAAADIAAAEFASIDAEAKKLADTKIDPSGGVTGIKRVAGVLAAIIGGLIQGRTGSARNMGLDALNQAIEQGISAQKAEIGQKQQALGLRRESAQKTRAMAAEEQRAADVMRMATLKHAENLLATEQQKFTPGGTRFLRAAEMRAQVAAEQAKQSDLINERNRKRALEDRKQALDEAQFGETSRNNRAQLGLGYAKLNSEAADRKEAKAARLQDKEFKIQDEQNERVRQFAIGGIPRLETDVDGKPVVGSDGKPLVTYGDMVNKDGQTWLIANPELRKQIGQKITAAKLLNDKYNRLIELRRQFGGESGWVNSDASQEYGIVAEEILGLHKEGTQNMSSDSDMEILRKKGGADDVSSFRDQTKKLEVARANVRKALNVSLRDNRYTGPEIHLPDENVDVAKLTPDEERVQKLLAKPEESSFDNEVMREILNTAPEGVPIADVAPDIVREAIAKTRRNWGTGASTQQRNEIGTLGDIAGSSSPAANKARGDLLKIAAEGHTPELRRLARAALEGADRSHLDTPVGTSTDVNADPGRPASYAEPASSSPGPLPLPDEFQ